MVLYRYHLQANPDFEATVSKLSEGFTDADQVSPWAEDAINWCLAEGLLQGSAEPEGLLLNPQGEVTRAQLATVLMRYSK